MKHSLALPAVSLALLLAACGTADVSDDTDTASSSSSSSAVAAAQSSAPFLDDQSSSVVLDVRSSEGAASAQTSSQATGGGSADVRVIELTVSDWAFSPALIMVKKGEKVQIKLTGDTGTHGFAVPSLGLNLRVEAGKSVVFDLPTDTAGTFDAFCSIPCGPGHRDMKAKIVVQ